MSLKRDSEAVFITSDVSTAPFTATHRHASVVGCDLFISTMDCCLDSKVNRVRYWHPFACQLSYSAARRNNSVVSPTSSGTPQ